MPSARMPEIPIHQSFESGSCWVRADFHLHTRADKQFQYSGENDDYLKAYAKKLAATGIKIGAVTNHNKFVREEFVNLRRRAKKLGSYLLPGVELSVNDGSNGVHVLVIFSEEWIAHGKDYITPAISAMFPGKSEEEYQHEDGRSDKNILSVVEELDKTGRDYFLIFAHVEQKSGLWHEFGGGKIGDLATDRYSAVRSRSLAFQKVRTFDSANSDNPCRLCRKKVRNLLQGWYPAEVEGSDCKSIAEVGKGNQCFLKVGEPSYSAVKFALSDPQARVSLEEKEPFTHSRISSVSFDGGMLDGKCLPLSSEFNSLIGIRGSGKSSVIEAIRFALGFEAKEDFGYKDKLIPHLLGSGGKVTLKITDRFGKHYEIRRVVGDSPEVFDEQGELRPGLSIRETVVHLPVYFGQKDLSAKGEGFESDLVEKLVGEKIEHKRREIAGQKAKVIEALELVQKLSNIDEEIKEAREKKQDAEHQIKIFAELGVAEKLQRQTHFDTDERKIKSSQDLLKQYGTSVREVLAEYEDELRNLTDYSSKENPDFFESYFQIYQPIIDSLDQLNVALRQTRSSYEDLKVKKQEFDQLKQAAKSEFAETRRELQEQLQEKGQSALNLDQFPQLAKIVANTEKLITALSKNQDKRAEAQSCLLTELSVLNELWREEFKLIEQTLQSVNESQEALQIKGVFKGDKEAFLKYFQSLYKGSRIRENTLKALVDEYPDFAAIYRNWDAVLAHVSGSSQVFEEYFQRNLRSLLSYQVPNLIEITYKGKPLLQHSLGQRASALILFVLSQHDNDVVIVDQPEDDLDNQTIYEDVIKLIRRMKSSTQFIFATHNANFPVLGDAELVHAFECFEDCIQVVGGGIDTPAIQTHIVNIMEGGRDAFDRRKQIYELWK